MRLQKSIPEIIDDLFMVQSFDWSREELENYVMKQNEEIRKLNETEGWNCPELVIEQVIIQEIAKEQRYKNHLRSILWGRRKNWETYSTI